MAYFESRVWPGDPRHPRSNPGPTSTRDGYYLRRFSLSEHGGTHLTAPASFFADGKSVDEFAPEDLVNPAAMMDVSDSVSRQPRLHPLHRRPDRSGNLVHGIIRACRRRCSCCTRDGPNVLGHDPPAYLGLGTNPDGGLHFPGFGVDVAAAHLVNRARRRRTRHRHRRSVEPGHRR